MYPKPSTSSPDPAPAADAADAAWPDATDRALMRATQAGLPLVAAPYAALGAALGIGEQEVIARFAAMQARGLMRRLGAVPNHYALGWRANGMTVWDVADEHVEALGRMVGALPFVSHCYQRPRRLPRWPYNLFAMIHARTRGQAMPLVAQIGALLGDACRERDVLWSTRILKKTGLRLPPGD